MNRMNPFRSRESSIPFGSRTESVRRLAVEERNKSATQMAWMFMIFIIGSIVGIVLLQLLVDAEVSPTPKYAGITILAVILAGSIVGFSYHFNTANPYYQYKNRTVFNKKKMKNDEEYSKKIREKMLKRQGLKELQQKGQRDARKLEQYANRIQKRRERNVMFNREYNEGEGVMKLVKT